MVSVDPQIVHKSCAVPGQQQLGVGNECFYVQRNEKCSLPAPTCCFSWTGLEPENKVLFSIKIKLMKLDMRTRKFASKIV